MEDRTNFAEAFLNAADWRASASSLPMRPRSGARWSGRPTSKRS